MQGAVVQGGAAQAVESKRKRPGKCRVHAGNITPQFRQGIVESFRAVRSSESVAETYGISSRTVTDVVLLDLLRGRSA